MKLTFYSFIHILSYSEWFTHYIEYTRMRKTIWIVKSVLKNVRIIYKPCARAYTRTHTTHILYEVRDSYGCVEVCIDQSAGALWWGVVTTSVGQESPTRKLNLFTFVYINDINREENNTCLSVYIRILADLPFF